MLVFGNEPARLFLATHLPTFTLIILSQMNCPASILKPILLPQNYGNSLQNN